MAPIPKPAIMPASQTVGAVVVGADPYVEPERLKAVFDADLTKAGVLPIQVFVENQGHRKVWVQGSEMRLESMEGSQIGPVRAVVAESQMPPSPPSTNVTAGESVGLGVLFMGVLFLSGGQLLLPVGDAKWIAEQDAATQRSLDYWNKALKEAILRKNESVHGFVYFIPASGTPAFDDATLVVPIVDLEAATRLIVRLPLSGLRFKGASAKGEQTEPRTPDDEKR